MAALGRVAHTTPKPAHLNPIRPIGYVRSRVDRGPHAGQATIELRPEFAPGLTGLERSSHAVVLFQAHEAGFDPATDLLYRPHADRRMRPAGVFAQRCPHRPNQLGVTTVKVLAVEGNRILVQGLEAWSGTPVLDIKPYLPWFDRPQGRVRVAEWFR